MAQWLMLDKAYRITRFPICLAVELVCSNEDSALLLHRFEKNAIGGDAGIAIHLDDIPHADILALHLFDAFRSQDSMHALLVSLTYKSSY